MSDAVPDWDGIIVRTVRYFGQTPDYWEDALTLRLHRSFENELTLNPPAEMFLGAWFRAQGWWQPSASEGEQNSAAPPHCDLPEYEP